MILFLDIIIPFKKKKNSNEGVSIKKKQFIKHIIFFLPIKKIGNVKYLNLTLVNLVKGS